MLWKAAVRDDVAEQITVLPPVLVKPGTQARVHMPPTERLHGMSAAIVSPVARTGRGQRGAAITFASRID